MEKGKVGTEGESNRKRRKDKAGKTCDEGKGKSCTEGNGKSCNEAPPPTIGIPFQGSNRGLDLIEGSIRLRARFEEGSRARFEGCDSMRGDRFDGDLDSISISRIDPPLGIQITNLAQHLCKVLR